VLHARCREEAQKKSFVRPETTPPTWRSCDRLCGSSTTCRGDALPRRVLLPTPNIPARARGRCISHGSAVRAVVFRSWQDREIFQGGAWLAGSVDGRAVGAFMRIRSGARPGCPLVGSRAHVRRAAPPGWPAVHAKLANLTLRTGAQICRGADRRYQPEPQGC